MSLDVIRGFALLGILVMNIQSFSMISAAYLNPTAYGDLTGANLFVWIVSHLLTDQKMYGLFSMLFGAGILLMTNRAAARAGRSAALHYRRMGWLILFGLLHAHLLWYGDILYSYGMCGLLVYLFRNRSPRALILLAGMFYLIGSSIYALLNMWVTSLDATGLELFKREAWMPTAEMIREELAAYRGSWLEQLPVRVEESLFMQTGIFLLMIAWKTIANMLLGMALFKSGVFSAERTTRFYVKMMMVGFAIGLPIVAVGIWRNFAAGWDVRYSFLVGSLYNYWGAVAVDFGWIGFVMLVYRSGALRGLVDRLAAIGRTAFSHYILQTLIATTLFYGHGFGLFGYVDRVGQILIVLAIWAVQLTIAPFWLRHFAFGPLEWVWRSLTYWRSVPLRREATPMDV